MGHFGKMLSSKLGCSEGRREERESVCVYFHSPKLR